MMSALRKTLSSRLPDFNSIVLVFSVVCLILYSWTIVSISWKLNAWLSNLTFWEITSMISYLMVFDFLEALLVIGGLLSLCFILPGNILKDHFVVRGTVIVLCILVSMMLHLYLNSEVVAMRLSFMRSFKRWWFYAFWVTLILTWMSSKFRLTVKAVEGFADRTTVFLFLLIPLSALGFVVIAIRFILGA